jgi:hypothetical protein
MRGAFAHVGSHITSDGMTEQVFAVSYNNSSYSEQYFVAKVVLTVDASKLTEAQQFDS